MDILPMPSIWLDQSAWDDVVGPLESVRQHAVPTPVPSDRDGCTPMAPAASLTHCGQAHGLEQLAGKVGSLATAPC